MLLLFNQHTATFTVDNKTLNSDYSRHRLRRTGGRQAHRGGHVRFRQVPERPQVHDNDLHQGLRLLRGSSARPTGSQEATPGGEEEAGSKRSRSDHDQDRETLDDGKQRGQSTRTWAETGSEKVPSREVDGVTIIPLQDTRAMERVF